MSRHVAPSSRTADPLAGISPIRSRSGAARHDDDISRVVTEAAPPESSTTNSPPLRPRRTNRLTVKLVVIAIQMVIRFMTSIQERRFITCQGQRPWWADQRYFGKFGRGAAVQKEAGAVVVADGGDQEQQQHDGGEHGEQHEGGVIHGDHNDQQHAEEELQRQQQRLVELAEQRSLRRQRRRHVSDEETRRIQQQSGFDELPESTVSTRFDTIDENDAALRAAAAAANDGSIGPSSFVPERSSNSNQHRVHTVSSNKQDVVEVLSMSVADAAKTLEEIPLADDFDVFPPRLVQGIFKGIRESHAFIADLLRYRVLRRRRFREELTGFPAELASSQLAAAAARRKSMTKVIAPGETTASSSSTTTIGAAEDSSKSASQLQQPRFLPQEDEAIKLICEAAKNSIVFKDWPDSIFAHVAENSAMWRKARNSHGGGGVVAGGCAGPVRRYLPGEPIVLHGENDGRVVYFLLRGAVWEVEKQNPREKALSLSKNARAKNLHGVQPAVAQDVVSALNSAAAQAERDSRQAAAAAARAPSGGLKQSALADMASAASAEAAAAADPGEQQDSFVPRRHHRARSNSVHSAVSSATGTTATNAFVSDDLAEMSRRMFGDGSSAPPPGGGRFAAAAASGASRPCVLRDGAAILHLDQSHRAFIAASTCVVAQMPFADLEDCFCGSDAGGAGSSCGGTYLPNSAGEWMQLARSRKRLLHERSNRTRHMSVDLLKKSLLLAELPDSQADTLVGHVRACSFLKNAAIVPREFEMADGADDDGNDDAGGGGGGNLALSAAKEKCEGVFCSAASALKTLRESIIWVVKGTAAASSRRRTKATDMQWARVVFFSFPAGSTLGEGACYFNKQPVFDVVATTMVDVLYLPRAALLQKTMFDASFRTAINNGALVLRQSSSVTALTIRTLRAVNWIHRAIDLELVSDQHLFDACQHAFKYKTFSPGEMIAATSDEVGAAFVLAAGTAVYNNQATQKCVPLWTLIGSEACVFPALRWARGVVAMTVCEVWYATPQLLRKHMVLDIPEALQVVADDGVSVVATRPKHRSGDHTLKGAVARQQRFLQEVHEPQLVMRGIRETLEQRQEKAQLFFAALNAWDDSGETKRLKLAAMRQVAVDQFDLQTDTVRCVKRASVKKKKKTEDTGAPSSAPSTAAAAADDEEEIDFNKPNAASDGLARVQKLKNEHTASSAKLLKAIDRIGPPRKQKEQQQQQPPAGSGVFRKKEKFGLATPLPDGPDLVREYFDQQSVAGAKERCRKNWDEIVDYSSPENRLKTLLDSQQKLQDTLHSPPKLAVHMSQPHGVRRAPLEEQEHFDDFKQKQEEHKLQVMRGGEFAASSSSSVSPDPAAARRHLDRYQPATTTSSGVPSLHFDRRRIHDRNDFGQDSVRVVNQGNAEEEMAGTPILLLPAASQSPEQQRPEFDSVVDATNDGGSAVVRQSALDVSSPKHNATRRMEQPAAPSAFRRENSADLLRKQRYRQEDDHHHNNVAVAARADDEAVAPSPVTLDELSAVLSDQQQQQQQQQSSNSSSFVHPRAADASATNQRLRHQLDDDDQQQQQFQRQRAAREEQRRKKQQLQQMHYTAIAARRDEAQASLAHRQVHGFANMNVRTLLGVTSTVPLHSKPSSVVHRSGGKKKKKQPDSRRQQHLDDALTPPPPWDSTMSANSPAAAAAAIIYGSGTGTGGGGGLHHPHQERGTLLQHLHVASPANQHQQQQPSRGRKQQHASTPQPKSNRHQFDAHMVAQEQQKKLHEHLEKRRKEIREGRTPSPQQQRQQHHHQTPDPKFMVGSGGSMYRHRQQQQQHGDGGASSGGAAGRVSPHSHSRNPGLPPMRPLFVARESGLKRMAANSPLQQGGSLVARAREMLQLKVQQEMEMEQQRMQQQQQDA